MQAWICLHALFLMNKTKDQSSWVLAHDLYWENKMYKQKRSIMKLNEMKMWSSQLWLRFKQSQRGGHWDFRFCGFGYFLDRFFGFCAKRLRFFGFGVRCSLRIFRFSVSGFRFSVFVEDNSGFSVLLSNVVFGFSYFESKWGFRFWPNFWRFCGFGWLFLRFCGF